MTTGALLMMVITEVSIIAITAYFFYKVFTSKKNDEPDSYSENDDEK